jgi:hypothetical protein
LSRNVDPASSRSTQDVASALSPSIAHLAATVR